jgi:hypothetical protein
MLEIKNIVNRDITGEPLHHYWIQMQVQMEVCDLDVCDFLETRFKECVDVNEWTLVPHKKGCIITNTINLPSQATANWYSPERSGGESLNILIYNYFFRF